MTVAPRHILPVIVLAQWLGTSTWFAGNAILPVLQSEWGLADSAVAPLTNSVQLGFICGALLFAFLAISDRVSPRILFTLSAAGAAFFNLMIALAADELTEVLVYRFLGGMMLAGVYPVGMKIATGWYPDGLGRALGFLVGALALGTASPHLFSAFNFTDWKVVIYIVSAGSLLGGLLVLAFVPDGPALHKGGALRLRDLWVAVKHKPLQASAGGYFGHMWELYAVFALLPYWLKAWSEQQQYPINISFWSFVFIAIGCLGCIVGGILSKRIGSRLVAQVMLCCSGICCLISPFMIEFSFGIIAIFWLVWGFTVVADSPQFSALSAQTAPPQVVGSALTMINAIGFTITVISVQLCGTLLVNYSVEWIMLLLLPGPILGVLSLQWLKQLEEQKTD